MDNETNNEQIAQFWDELSEFGAHQSDVALNFCLERICELISADNACWVGAVRIIKGDKVPLDSMSGWRAGASYMLHKREETLQSIKQVMSETDGRAVGDNIVKLIATAGTFRAHTLQSGNLLDIDAFKKTDYYDVFYRQPGIEDRLWILFPVSEDAESLFFFDTHKNERHFTEDEIALASQIFRGIKWFHRQLLLSHGLGICVKALTPAERRVEHHLLSGKSEREIADKLSLSPGTVHQHAVKIYRKFGVNSRAEFMSLWLKGHL